MGHEHPKGDPGDLIISLRLDADEGRRWEGDRLIQEVPVTITKLLLGGKVKIRTPLGKMVQIEIPSGTKIGDRRRLNGHGHAGGILDIEFVLSEIDNITPAQKSIRRIEEGWALTLKQLLINKKSVVLLWRSLQRLSILFFLREKRYISW